MKKSMRKIILASKSPRRSELLRQIGLEFEVIVSDAEEKISGNLPKEVVIELSDIKAQSVYDMLEKSEYKKFERDNNDANIIIGADTVVAIGDSIIGKPENREHAREMLRRLSGRQHSVWTGVTIITEVDGKVKKESFAKETKVKMFEISEHEIEEYISTGEPDDKAGAYGIQGIGGKFIEYIEGDYNNVVGLPVSEIYQRIKG